MQARKTLGTKFSRRYQ